MAEITNNTKNSFQNCFGMPKMAILAASHESLVDVSRYTSSRIHGFRIKLLSFFAPKGVLK